MITVGEKKMRSFLVAAAMSLVAPVAFAQSPYAGMQTRSSKSLSEQQIADLKAGRGMGLALPAELNGYPGPAHVLELSDQLGLSAEQKARVQSLFDAMKAEAVPLGERLLEQEAALDQQFASRTVTPQRLKTATAAIGVTQGKLRETHLKYHLQTAQILTPDQMQRYSALRGYGSTVPTQHQHQHQMQ
jgi:Spy/CpxP family protein refolding chaperone